MTEVEIVGKARVQIIQGAALAARSLCRLCWRELAEHPV